MAERTAAVLGGGIGGVVAARRLRRRLGKRHRVVVVNRSPELVFAPSLLWLLEDKRRPEAFTRDLRRLGRFGIDLEVTDALEVDLGGQAVKTARGSVAYDQLVVALGAELAPSAMPGFEEAAHNLYTLEGATRARDALQQFGGGRVVVLVSSIPYKCPAAPYEAALIADGVLRRRGVRDASTVEIVTPEPQPLPVAGPAAGAQVAGLLSGRGIDLHIQRPAERIDAENRRIVLADGESVPFDLLIGVPPHRPPELLSRSGLVDNGGFVPVDARTLETSTGGVYAIGDVAAIKLADGKPLPKAGVFAEREALVVADRIAAEFSGKPATAEFSGGGECFLETGDGRAGFARGDFYGSEGPEVRFHPPARRWHWGKVAFEKFWLRRWV